MVTAILTIVAGLIAALPQLLTLLEARQITKAGASNAQAKQDSNLLDSVLPPTPGV